MVRVVTPTLLQAGDNYKAATLIRLGHREKCALTDGVSWFGFLMIYFTRAYSLYLAVLVNNLILVVFWDFCWFVFIFVLSILRP